MLNRKILLEKHFLKIGEIVYYDYGFVIKENLPGFREIEKCTINRIWEEGMELKICNTTSYIGGYTNKIAFDAIRIKTKINLQKAYSRYSSF